MSRADITKQIADLHYRLADLYLELAGESVAAPAAAPVAAEGPSAAPPYGEGSDVVCPAHKQAYIEGKFGLMCPAKGTDPAWTNSRGYCSINPKSVAAYLRTRAAA
jgi:hypothetical protein